METERERMLHAIYDAWKLLEAEAEMCRDPLFVGAERAILRGQLEAAQYPPYLRSQEAMK